jgi:hypothetical protein
MTSTNPRLPPKLQANLRLPRIRLAEAPSTAVTPADRRGHRQADQVVAPPRVDRAAVQTHLTVTQAARDDPERAPTQIAAEAERMAIAMPEAMRVAMRMAIAMPEVELLATMPEVELLATMPGVELLATMPEAELPGTTAGAEQQGTTAGAELLAIEEERRLMVVASPSAIPAKLLAGAWPRIVVDTYAISTDATG